MTIQELKELNPILTSFTFRNKKIVVTHQTACGLFNEQHYEQESEAEVVLDNGVFLVTPIKNDTLKKIYDVVLKEVLQNFKINDESENWVIPPQFRNAEAEAAYLQGRRDQQAEQNKS